MLAKNCLIAQVSRILSSLFLKKRNLCFESTIIYLQFLYYWGSPLSLRVVWLWSETRLPSNILEESSNSFPYWFKSSNYTVPIATLQQKDHYSYFNISEQIWEEWFDNLYRFEILSIALWINIPNRFHYLKEYFQ